MARWEQYEVWGQAGERWQMIGAFMDIDIATAVARARKARVRVVRAVFEDSKRVEEQILVEIGATRETG